MSVLQRCLMTPEQVAHLMIVKIVGIFHQAEIEGATQSRLLFGRWMMEARPPRKTQAKPRTR